MSIKKSDTVRSVLGFLGIVVLAVGVILGVALVESQQLFSQKAAESPTAAEKIAEIAKNIGQESDPRLVNYTSENLGYKFSFDKNYWTPDQGDLRNPNLDKVSFTLNNNAGLASVNFSAFPNSGKDNLDSLAAKLATQKRPVSTEKIRRQGRDYYKFTFETNFLNVKSTYYEYVTVSGDNYYIITAKYPDFSDASVLTENLIDSFSFQEGSSVQGITAFAQTESALDETKIVELTKPSVVQIAHLYCNDINLPDTTGLRFLKPNYRFCDGSLGSGFIINKDGFVATNGHVAKQYPNSSLIQGLLNMNPLTEPFFIDLVRELVLIQTGDEVSFDQAKNLLDQSRSDPNYFESFVVLVYNLIQENIMALAPAQEKHFVKLANDPITINQSKLQNDFVNAIDITETIREASLVSFNYPNMLSQDAVLNAKKEVGSDVAIIKIVNPGNLIFPSINLGTSEGLKEGSNIIVIGYPGLVSGNDESSLVNARSSAQPTVTRGIISAIKTDQGGLKLIQVDASIDHGNSGGPAVDSEGNVIGIATYGIGSASGNYNFLRDIEDLKSLAGENSISAEASSTYIEWSEGLGYFWRERYKQAVQPFDKVETAYPIHPLVASYVSDSEEAIQKGQDKSDFMFLILNDRQTQITAAGITLAIALGGSVVIVLMKKRRSQNRPPSQSLPQNMPPQPQTPTVVTPTPTGQLQSVNPVETPPSIAPTPEPNEPINQVV